MPIKNLKVRAAGESCSSEKGCSVLLSSEEFHEMLKCGYKPLSANPEFSSAINRIADLISSMPIHLMKNSANGDVRINNNLSRFIDISPNKFMTRKIFIFNIVKTLLEQGNSVVMPETKNGIIESLDIISPDCTSFIPDGVGYYISIAGEKYMPDEVLHFVHNPKMPYPWKGNGYDVSLKDIINNLFQATETKKGFMESKWKPSLIIKADGINDGFDSKESRKRILNSYFETTETGQPWIVPAELFDVTEIKPLSLNDLAINDSVNVDKKTVAAVLGVPEFIVGIGNFNKEEWNNFINTRLQPLCNIIEQEMTRKLLISPEWYLRFNFKSLYSYDIQTLSTVGANLYTRGIVTGNEVRNWIDEPPLEGLDELVILENYIPQGMIGDQKKLNGGGENNAT
ncbi:MAG: phage portal protein [Eubacterium sp.]